MEGDPNQCGHIICTVAGSGPTKQTINYSTERVVGNGSFGVVFQATCLESGETVRSTLIHQYRTANSQQCMPWLMHSPLGLNEPCIEDTEGLRGWLHCAMHC